MFINLVKKLRRPSNPSHIYLYFWSILSSQSHFKLITCCNSQEFLHITQHCIHCSYSSQEHSSNHHPVTPLSGYCDTSLNFLATSGGFPKPDHVIDSSSLINIPVKSNQIKTGVTVLNNDNIDKLALCTESLGFESCNERSLDSVFEDLEKSFIQQMGLWCSFHKNINYFLFGLVNQTTPKIRFSSKYVVYIAARERRNDQY